MAEVAGLAFGLITLPLVSLQLLESIIKDLESLSVSQVEILHLLHETHRLKDVLFRVRDLIEQQATDDANIDILSIVTREGRDLTELLSDLAFFSRKLRQSPSTKLRVKSYLEAPIYRQKIHGRLLNLQVLLQSNGWSPTTATNSLVPQHSSSGQSIAIADWLDDAESTAILEDLTSRYESGTGSSLLSNSSFRQWKKAAGSILWGSGSGELPVFINIVRLLSATIANAVHLQ